MTRKRPPGPPRLMKLETNALEQLRSLGGVDVSTYRVSMRLEHPLEKTLRLLEQLVAKGRVTMELEADGLARVWSIK